MMKALVNFNGEELNFDLERALDVSMPLRTDANAAKAWYVPPLRIEAVRTEHFIGDVNQGGSVNFNDIYFNPHGHGTHTESLGHISPRHESVNQCLKQFHFVARLISIQPRSIDGDLVIRAEDVKKELTGKCQAVLIRTLPNSDEKLTRQYSDTNPPYIEASAIDHLLDMGVDHLLIDLPSVDKEVDNGVLSAHHRFWNFPDHPAQHRTITEFIYVPNEIEDGLYLLNIQLSPFENDAAPSKPVLFPLIKKV